MMKQQHSPTSRELAIGERTRELFDRKQSEVYRRTDRMFGVLMLVQWAAALAAAQWLTPTALGAGAHLSTAIFGGGAIVSLPLVFAFARPGRTATRYIISCAQMLMSSLLIHLSGGRIETHFHIFGSLAFLAFYRDWRVLVPATALVAADHFLRGVYLPHSLYGTEHASHWRWLEHLAWVAFEDIFLLISIRKSVGDMSQLSRRRAVIEEAVEARDQSLRALAESEAQYRMLFSNNPLPTFVYDPDTLRFIAVNDAAVEIYGYTREEFLEMTVTAIRPEEDLPRILAVINSPRPSGKYIGEWRHVKKNGELLDVEVTGQRIPHEGRAVNFAVVADITTRKRAAEEAGRLLAAEQELNRQKDEFLAAVSHELRTPLTSIIGWGHLLSSSQLEPEDAARAVSVIVSNAEAQKALIDDLLDSARLMRGDIKLDMETLDMAELTRAAVVDAIPLASEKSIIIHFENRTKRETNIHGSRERLRQVLWNLLTNAIKFTPAGGHVTLSLEAGDETLCLRVSDTGKGISAEFLPYIFERFRQAEGLAADRQGGLGLGLSIAKHLTELHGGSLEASSEGENRGATFALRLPLLHVQEAPPAAPARKDEARGREDLSGLCVLVVDDEENVRDVVGFILERRGASVRRAASGEEALAAIIASRPDLLISDLMMPNGDGYELIERVRAEEVALGLGRLPAMALTALAGPEVRVKVMQAGFQIYILKPIEPAELTAAVAALVTNCEWQSG